MVIKNNKQIVVIVMEQSMCLDCFNHKTMSLQVCDSNLDSGNFEFIKILAQIINIFLFFLKK
jgi:hypothetical protein